MMSWCIRGIILAMVVIAALVPLHILTIADVRVGEIGLCFLAFVLSKVIKEPQSPPRKPTIVYLDAYRKEQQS